MKIVRSRWDGKTGSPEGFLCVWSAREIAKDHLKSYLEPKCGNLFCFLTSEKRLPKMKEENEKNPNWLFDWDGPVSHDTRWVFRLFSGRPKLLGADARVKHLCVPLRNHFLIEKKLQSLKISGKMDFGWWFRSVPVKSRSRYLLSKHWHRDSHKGGYN